MKRFLFASKKINKTATSLINKGYHQKKSCTNEGEQPTFILIDRKKKTFFLADKEVLEYVNSIIKDRFKKNYKSTNIKKITKWQN